jgi:hypothetical protein
MTSAPIMADPKAALLAALVAARESLLAAVALVPAGERATRPVCGVWSLKDVLGHIADWEAFGVDGLRHMAAGQEPQVEYIPEINGWNRVHVQARRDQPWEQVWDDFQATRQAFLDLIAGMTWAELERRFPFPWGPEGTPMQWIRVYADHDRAHARGIRAAIGPYCNDN